MVEGEQQGPVLVGTFFNGLRLGIWLKMEDPQVRVPPPKKPSMRRCAFARPEMEDLQMRVRPLENGGSPGERSPALK